METSPEVNKQQFNKQAEVFAQWSGTTNTEYMEFLAHCIGLTSGDHLLDVACGSGSFAAYVLSNVKFVVGIDISDKQVSIANKHARDLGLRNIGFVCGNVEKLPFRENAFSAVISKSAFHHFTDPERVFGEIYRVCQPGGVICIDDISTYVDPDATCIIDQFDKLIDVSHNRRMSTEEVTRLFLNRRMKVIRTKINEFERSFQEYQGHALQTLTNATKLKELVSKNVRDRVIYDVLYDKNGEIFFLNRGFTIVGKKQT